MSPQVTGLAIVKGTPFALVETDPRVVASAKKLEITPDALVRSMQGNLQTDTGRWLYLTFQAGESGLNPGAFHMLFVVLMGREPLERDLASVPDGNHKNVSRSNSTKIYEFFEGVIDLLREAEEANIQITHLQAAWLVLRFGERADTKLDELFNDVCRRSQEKLHEDLTRRMMKNPSFARYLKA